MPVRKVIPWGWPGLRLPRPQPRLVAAGARSPAPFRHLQCLHLLPANLADLSGYEMPNARFWRCFTLPWSGGDGTLSVSGRSESRG